MSYARLAMLTALLATAAAGTAAGASAETLAPRVVSAPTITGNTIEGDQLGGATGSWSGDSPITFALQWQRCDQGGATCSDIVGATEASYLLDAPDVGHTVRLHVTATNSSGSGAADSAPTAIIESGQSGLPIGATAPTPGEAAGAASVVLKTLRGLHLGQIRHKSGFLTRFSVPAGTLAKIELLLGKVAPKSVRGARTLVLAQGSVLARQGGRVPVRVRLTQAGRSAMKSARTLTTTLRVTLRREGSSATALRVVTLRR